MKLPARLLRNNGVTLKELAKVTGQTIQYVSMQLNGHRPMTTELTSAIRELVEEPGVADQVQEARGKD